MESKKTTNSRSLRPGVSMIELVTGFGIIGIISVMVAGVYFAHFKIFSNQNTSIEVNESNRIALDEMISQIRQGQAVVSTCSACSGDTTGSSVIVLRLWPLNASGDPTDPTSGNYDYVVYKQDAANTKNLIKKVLPDASSTRPSVNKIIATNTQSLAFSYDNADPTSAGEITVTLTSSATSINKTHTVTYSSKAILRNK